MKRWTLLLACLALASCDGTSDWILRERPQPPGAAIDAGTGGGDAREPADFAAACSPALRVENRTASGSGKLFGDNFAQPTAFVQDTARRVCALLYKTPSEVPRVRPITLIIDELDPPGAIGAAASGVQIELSSRHMQRVADAGGDVRSEIAGILYYLIGTDYTLDDEDPAAVSWLISGIGDWVRYRAGYTVLSRRKRGGDVRAGQTTTAFFLAWLDDTYPDAVYDLNQSLDPEDGSSWSEQTFRTISGKSLDQLWSDYQASL
jgi:Peptidase of plants and bacteria